MSETRSLLRLNQLASEIQNAISREDYDLVFQAASLLAPALSHWEAETAAHAPDAALETAGLASATQRALQDSETRLTAAKTRVGTQIRRVRQGRRVVSQALTSRRLPPAGLQVDTGR